MVRYKEEQNLAEKKTIEYMLGLYYFPPKELPKEEKKMDSGKKPDSK